jgi:hypothetical protein
MSNALGDEELELSAESPRAFLADRSGGEYGCWSSRCLHDR